MSVTLQPVFRALGYREPQQQRSLIKLLQAGGAFGELKGVDGILNDHQARAVLEHVTFDNARQAAQWLHDATQTYLIKRGAGMERQDIIEPPFFQKYRAELSDALHQTGMLDEVKPQRKHYDHVLLLGAMESMVDDRFDTLKKLWDEGVRCERIHLLGSERALQPHEPSVAAAAASEMQMMESRYAHKSAQWHKGLKQVRVFEVNTFNQDNGARANTQDTIKSWLEINPHPGSVLVISSQPYARYQHAAVQSVLPDAHHVETVGAAAAPQDIKIGMALDTLARQIDVGMPKLLATLAMQKPALETPLRQFDPAVIEVDAPTYQFRSGGDTHGVTNTGRFASERWDPVLHGDPIMVHERLDGRVFVADGHHRLDLAKRLNAKGQGPGTIVAMVLREADGYTPRDVKIIAAYKNIAHGQTNPIDTARVFKEAYSGQVHTELLPQLQMDKGNLRMSFSLAKLSEPALKRVEAGEIPVDFGAAVAERAGDAAQQERVIDLIGRQLRLNYKTQTTLRPDITRVHMPAPAAVKKEPGFVDKLLAQRAKQAQPASLMTMQ